MSRSSSSENTVYTVPGVEPSTFSSGSNTPSLYETLMLMTSRLYRHGANIGRIDRDHRRRAAIEHRELDFVRQAHPCKRVRRFRCRQLQGSPSGAASSERHVH